MTKLTGIMLILSSIVFWGMAVQSAMDAPRIYSPKAWGRDDVLMAVACLVVPLLGFWMLLN